MNVFTRSWNLTKLTFGVINKDRELLVFAFLSMVTSTVYTVLMMVPSLLPLVVTTGWDERTTRIVQVSAAFLTYFGIAFIATFFNVCVVFTAKTRFEGGNATFGQSFAFALSRAGLIARWSLVSATVGLVLHLIQGSASRLGRAGKVVGDLLVGILGFTWSIVTLFVVPVLVYEKKGPFAAIGKSVQVIKKTWGESLVKGVGLGIIQFLTLALVLVATVAGAYSAYEAFSWTGLFVVLGTGAVLLLLAGLVFAVANTVFNTALYVYAETGKVAEGFDAGVVAGALGPR